ncbi:MAG TPA: DoxX family membrane protein [Opitutaceae bacterium]|jgi:thiosulfate dehydrogenase [quinone] large subunit
MQAAPRQAYALLRLILGIDMFLHGATRIGSGVGGFAATVVRDFHAALLPAPLVQGYALALPFAEALIGALLILGLFTRFAVVLGSLFMASLIFGTALRSDWNTAGLQLIYAAIYYLLLAKIGDNAYSVDGLRRRPRESENRGG